MHTSSPSRGPWCSRRRSDRVVAVEHIMGMPVIVDVRDEDLDERVLEHMFDSLRFVDATFSTYKGDSEIRRMNRGELAVAAAHPDVREVLARCEALCLATDAALEMRGAG